MVACLETWSVGEMAALMVVKMGVMQAEAKADLMVVPRAWS
jgi:hypothetical protein